MLASVPLRDVISEVGNETWPAPCVKRDAEPCGAFAARLSGKRPGHPLHDFREKLLQRWPTIQDAFHAIDAYLSKASWR